MKNFWGQRLRIAVLLWIAIFLLASRIFAKEMQIGYASWYSLESCKREGTTGIMANGKELRDDLFTCASWDWPFNTRLLVRNLANGKEVIVIVSDRGPAKRLYNKGRIIDLSKASFSKIANLKEGIIKVKIEPVK